MPRRGRELLRGQDSPPEQRHALGTRQRNVERILTLGRFCKVRLVRKRTFRARNAECAVKTWYGVRDVAHVCRKRERLFEPWDERHSQPLHQLCVFCAESVIDEEVFVGGRPEKRLVNCTCGRMGSKKRTYSV